MKHILILLIAAILTGCSSLSVSNYSNQHGPDTFFKGENIAMASAIDRQDVAEITRLVQQEGYDVNTRGNVGLDDRKYKWTYLNYAVKYGKLQSVETLLKLGADIDMLAYEGRGNNYASGYGNMNLATNNGDIAMINLLLNYDIDLNNKRTESPFTTLTVSGHDTPELFDLLIAHGADVNHPEYISGNTPLMTAYTLKKLNAVDYFLAHGANPLKLSTSGHSFASSLQLDLERNRNVEIAERYKQHLIRDYGIHYPINVSFRRGIEESIRRYETATAEENQIMGPVELARINVKRESLKTGIYRGVAID